MARILIVDDHKNMRVTLGLILRREGHDVAEAEDGEQAVTMLSEGVDLVLTDLKMKPQDGIEVLRRVKQTSPATEVIVMTAFGTIDSAVEAMRLGAADYITKPFQETELLVRIAKALEKRQLVQSVNLLQSEFRERYNLQSIVGNSQSIRDVLARVLRAAPTDSTVLITGENGTGKELVAKAIHVNSKRSDKPFVPVNCAAISEQLLESELFGHVKGSFTGAAGTRKGLMEEADGGTFFFDEVAEMSPSLQAKLLRTIQEHEIRRVGDNRAIQVDVRIIAATNRHLEEEIDRGRFRRDLYYRLNVIPIALPPLRERRQDIPILATHFLQKFNRKMGRSLRLTESSLARLIDHDYPGNVRELENLIEQAVALAESDVIGPEHIFLRLPRAPGSMAPLTLDEVVAAAERRAIEDSLARHNGMLEAVTRELGLSPTTLWRKMKRHGLSRARAMSNEPI
jgi:two-component system response regulator HydG